jgi:23S rRNA (guanosine2251-2'-O)-methyltransferase
MIVVLNNIRSLHNIGSIFRTSDAVGVEKIYLCGYTSAPKDEFGASRSQIAKTALGAEHTMLWEKQKSATKLLDRLHRDGFKIYAVELDKRSTPYHKVKLSARDLQKAVVVMGNEVTGLSPAVLRRADKILEIPMFGHKESLNVSVAYGVVVYGLRLNSRGATS